MAKDAEWRTTVSDFNAVFQPIFPRRSLADALAGKLDREDVVHLIVTAEGKYVPSPHFEMEMEEEQRDVSENIDVLTDMQHAFKKHIHTAKYQQNPSKAANSSGYYVIQAGDDTAPQLMDCRYAKSKLTNTVAPAIELFCPAFAQFSSSAFNLNVSVPNDVIRETQNLMASMAAIYPREEKRAQAVHVLLGKLLGKEIGSAWNAHGTNTDGVIRGSTNMHDTTVLLALAEFKNELGGGNLDPSTQVGFIYTRTIAQAGAKIAHYCSSPAFLIVQAGPWLVILGAIFTDKFIVQRLTDFIWIPVHSCHDDAQFLRIARIFYALRKALTALDSWYQSIVGVVNLQRYDSKSRPTAAHPRFFPTPTSYPGFNGPINVNYTQTIDSCVSCVTYLAMTQDFRKVVVKFVDNYGAAAHRVMAKEGFAPTLLYYGFIDPYQPSLYKDVRMVVMEFVDGKTVDDMEINDKLPDSFSEQLKMLSAIFTQNDLSSGIFDSPIS